MGSLWDIVRWVVKGLKSKFQVDSFNCYEEIETLGGGRSEKGAEERLKGELILQA